MTGALRKRKRNAESAEDEVKRRSSAVVAGFSALRHKMLRPTSMTDKDLVELTLILHEALATQKKGFLPTEPMMSAFIRAIYDDWNLDYLLDSPPPLEEELCRNFFYCSHEPSTPQDPAIVQPVKQRYPQLHSDVYFEVDIDLGNGYVSYMIRGIGGEGQRVEKGVEAGYLGPLLPDLMEVIRGEIIDEFEDYNNKRAVHHARCYLEHVAFMDSGAELRFCRNYNFASYPEFFNLYPVLRIGMAHRRPKLFGEEASSW